jgi:glycosyltransferase involved in cell wall biosynthesis
MKSTVSVVICVRDVEKFIGVCIESLLEQTFKDFEIVIIGDDSRDHTGDIVRKFNDKRIRYFENEKNLGIAKSRNRGLAVAEGKYIFFTDGDCFVAKDWIKQGLSLLKNADCVGVEGRICYVSEKYQRTFSDHVSENKFGGQFMTGNMVYKKSVIDSVRGFDERYIYFEDRDLALRTMKYGKIRFNPNMIVYAQQQTLTPKELVASADQVKSRVLLFKKLGERELMLWRCVRPRNLARALFPPLIFLNLFFHKFKKADDFRVLPFFYVFAIRERLQLWRECVKQRVFLF